MHRFNVGQELYIHKTNQLATVIDKHITEPNCEPTYLIRVEETDSEYIMRESHLYLNPNQFKNARFRVDEIVYFIPNKRPVIANKYSVKSIYFDEYSQDIIYVCVDGDKKQKKFWGHQLYNYPFSTLPR